ncbi:MAG: RNA methyltransferase [Corynebacteriales bacterium]|nr:RNA methyltransferase [Mycobacteriales bacterium]
MTVHPRERFLTVFGRNPVLEVLADSTLAVEKIVIAQGARGGNVNEIVRAARRRGVAVQEATPARVKALAGNGRQDQGVVADVVAPRMASLDSFLSRSHSRDTRVLLLDSITNPANVGMILRSATAAGIDGIVVPQRGTAAIGPLTIKASAGVAFAAPILRTREAGPAAVALARAGFDVVGLSGEASVSVYDWMPTRPTVFVLGGESEGMSEPVRAQVGTEISIPMAHGVESLNVAVAASVLCFELARRGR